MPAQPELFLTAQAVDVAGFGEVGGSGFHILIPWLDRWRIKDNRQLYLSLVLLLKKSRKNIARNCNIFLDSSNSSRGSKLWTQSISARRVIPRLFRI